ncbi:hypothetical protein BGX29_003708 [Mortierella sp. GBA35]|nr:hypothetical protein BGX29_003708 [Mortierella sp. GBA35]
MIHTPPFAPLSNTAAAITRILSETNDHKNLLDQIQGTGTSATDSQSNLSFRNRITVLDEPINTILVAEVNKYSALDSPALLEAAFKMRLLTIQDELGTQIAALKDALFRCLDLLLRCSELELFDHSIPINLIEEVLDCQTVECSEHVYSYLESRVERLTVNMVNGKGKYLTLLRLCNELLRRLSKAKNTVFCGRILMLLSRVFPITERGGVNLRGDFNLENVTLIESEDVVIVPELALTPPHQKDDSQVPAGEAMDVDQEPGTPAKEQKEEEKSGEEAKAQSRFYAEFWGLQSFFNNPALLAKPEHMTKLREGIDHTLDKFTAIEEAEQNSRGQRTDSTSTAVQTPTSEPAAESTASQAVEKKKHNSAKDRTDVPNAYFPKFLTSPKLLQLEIVDPYFRKHILVQFLIILQYLLFHTPASKELQSKTANKAFMPQWILQAADEEWTETTRPKILKHLKMVGLETGDPSFLSTVEYILKREENWVHWKADGCPQFEKQSWTAEQVEQTGQKRKRLSLKLAPMKQRLGSETLTRLWHDVKEEEEMGDTGFGCSKPPMDAEAYIDHIYFLTKDKNLREKAIRKRQGLLEHSAQETEELMQGRFWRSLRLGVQQYIHLYEHMNKKDFNFLALRTAVEKDDAFEATVRENGGKVPEPEASAAETTETISQADETPAGIQEQMEEGESDEANLAEGEQEAREGAQAEDEDMKEVDAVDGTDAPAASSSPSTSSPPAAAGTTTAAKEGQEEETAPVKRGAASPAEASAADTVMDSTSTLADNNSSSV